MNAQPPSATASIKRTLIIGFAVVLLFLAAMALIGLKNMTDMRQTLARIVENHNVKTALVSAMRNAARERTIAMFRMVTLADPFDRDAEFLQFNRYAAEFARARTALIAMELEPREQEILAAQAALTAEAVGLQNLVVDLAIADRTPEAIDLLYRESVPAQDRVFVRLTELQDYQTASSQRASADAQEQFERSRRLLVLVGALALGIGAAIALVVIRHSSRTELRLFREKERAQVTLHSIGDGVITTNSAGQVEYLNVVAQQLIGMTSENARGRALPDVLTINDENGERMRDNPISRVLSERTILKSGPSLELVNSQQQRFAIEYTAAPILSVDGGTLGAILVFRNITELREMSRRMAHQATHDALTGLVNRGEFERRVNVVLASSRTEPREHMLLYMDLDQFKVVNDTCGHIAGDELLKQIAARLKTHVRRADTLARLGGDEFGILLIDCAVESALKTAHAIRAALTEFRFAWEDKTFEISTSIGVVPIRPDSGTFADVLSHADSACYVAKDLGRNRVHLYQPDDNELARRRGEMQWLPRIRHALKENRFCLYHQRIAPLDPVTGAEHYEILVRMLDAENRIVPPGAFIPAAERYNLMPAIDRWVLSAALEFFRAHPHFVNGATRLWAINLSGQSMCDDTLLEFILSELSRTGVPPHALCFEVTETTAVSNLARASQLIRALKDQGCRFALDDFGAGLSSFGYLKVLPVDYLKIDGGFVKDMLSDSMSNAMVQSINQIGHVLGLKTIAEFVENDALARRLRDIGVDYAQGYGVHKPEPLTAFARSGDVPRASIS